MEHHVQRQCDALLARYRSMMQEVKASMEKGSSPDDLPPTKLEESQAKKESVLDFPSDPDRSMMLTLCQLQCSTYSSHSLTSSRKCWIADGVKLGQLQNALQPQRTHLSEGLQQVIRLVAFMQEKLAVKRKSEPPPDWRLFMLYSLLAGDVEVASVWTALLDFSTGWERTEEDWQQLRKKPDVVIASGTGKSKSVASTKKTIKKTGMCGKGLAASPKGH
jgi:hypothetical protein